MPKPEPEVAAAINRDFYERIVPQIAREETEMTIDVKPGQNEHAVRSTLPARPAGILWGNDVLQRTRSCFAGFFNGAKKTGSLYNGALKIGKAECEWDWQETWAALQDLGLITYTVETRTAPSGYEITDVTWTLTPKGRQVREDDLKYFDELMFAIQLDEKLNEAREPTQAERDEAMMAVVRLMPMTWTCCRCKREFPNVPDQPGAYARDTKRVGNTVQIVGDVCRECYGK